MDRGFSSRWASGDMPGQIRFQVSRGFTWSHWWGFIQSRAWRCRASRVCRSISQTPVAPIRNSSWRKRRNSSRSQVSSRSPPGTVTVRKRKPSICRLGIHPARRSARRRPESGLKLVISPRLPPPVCGPATFHPTCTKDPITRLLRIALRVRWWSARRSVRWSLLGALWARLLRRAEATRVGRARSIPSAGA